MKSLIVLSTVLILSLSLIAGVDREFIFDIHDAASTTEQYSNEALLIPVYQTADADLMLSDDFAGELPALHSKIPLLLRASNFKATSTETLTFSDKDDENNLITIITTGLGSSASKPLSLESFRRSFGRALREAEKNNIAIVHIAIPPCVAAPIKQIAQEIATVSHLALYEYHGLTNTKKPHIVKRVCVHAHMETPQDFKDVNIGLRIGTNIGMAICQARDWINAPASIMTPMILANSAAQFIQPYIAKIETIIFEKEDIARMGMGGLLGVAQGSDQPCAFIVHYLKARRPHAPTIALVGNGITCDANNGGTAMSGAAAVLSVLHVLAYRNVPANIVIISPLTEHVTNEYAMKAGDLLTLCNKKTVEIVDPNAVGELILADALACALYRYKPDYIIDIAALTESSKQTFGPSYAAIMSNSDALIAYAYQAAAQTGESVWQLPLHEDYAARLQSDNADIGNTPKTDRTAGAQTAGCFLQEFVGETPWLHIDTTGVADARADNPCDHTAFGVRLLVALVELLAHTPQ